MEIVYLIENVDKGNNDKFVYFSLVDIHYANEPNQIRPVDTVKISKSGELPIELKVDAEGNQIPVGYIFFFFLAAAIVYVLVKRR